MLRPAAVHPAYLDLRMPVRGPDPAVGPFRVQVEQGLRGRAYRGRRRGGELPGGVNQAAQHRYCCTHRSAESTRAKLVW